MKFVFTHHSKYRIDERKISIDLIKKTIQNPEKKVIEDYGIILARKRFGDKSLEVVYKFSKNKFVIITAYYEN